MSLIKTFVDYSKLRLDLSILIILPIILLFFSLNLISQLTLPLVTFTLIFVLFFRTFDDLMCIEYDKSFKENRFYFDSKYLKDIKILSITCLILLLILAATVSTKLLLPIILLVLLSYFLYKKLQDQKGILFISLLKYPLFIYIISYHLNIENHLWPMVIFGFFVVKELMDEQLIMNNNFLKYSIIISALSFKAINWSQA